MSKRIRRPAIERLLARIDSTQDGCWIWPGARNHRGYGQIGGDNGRTASAHRVAYEGLVGPIPDGLMIDHLCRTRACVNPAHMEPVTDAENKRRAIGFIEPTHLYCLRGHERTEENTYRAPSGVRHCRVCVRIRCAAYKARKRQECAA